MNYKIIYLMPLVFSLACTKQTTTSEVVIQTKEAEGFVLNKAAVSQKLSLPGELKPFEEVSIYPRSTGFIKEIRVDRGSFVKKGDILAILDAPETIAQMAEAKARMNSAKSKKISAYSSYQTSRDTYERIVRASQTQGAISANDLQRYQSQMREDSARYAATLNDEEAASAGHDALKQLAEYLVIRAPFDGTITERNVHTGALMTTQNDRPMFRMEMNQKLRLAVAIPELYSNRNFISDTIKFSVNSHPGQEFIGIVKRQSGNLHMQTRTEMIEADVENKDQILKSGSFAQVDLDYKKPNYSFLIPVSAMVTTMEGKFVIRVKNQKAERISISEGIKMGDKIEVFGPLNEGDYLMLQANEEVKNGTDLVLTSL
jgi:membrane fusion protein, multidrug efflux system